MQTSTPARTSHFRRIFKAFHYRDFRLMWFGACTSSIGTWMQIVAQGWLIYRLSHSAFLLALDQFLRRHTDLSVLADRRGGCRPGRAAQGPADLAVRSDGERGYAHLPRGARTDARVADPLPVHGLWAGAGLRRSGLFGADSYAGRPRRYAQRDRAEFHPVQSGGDHWTGARRTGSGETGREVVLRAERAVVPGAHHHAPA